MKLDNILNNTLYHSYNTKLEKRDLQKEEFSDIQKDNVTISYTDDDKKQNDKVAIAFRDATKAGKEDELVVVNIDQETFEKLQSKYKDEDFMQNENGVFVLNNDAEQYVSNWYNDLAYNQGYLEADLDQDGNLNDFEYGQVRSGFDMKLSYEVTNNQVGEVEASMAEKYLQLGNLNYYANTTVDDLISKYPEKVQEELKRIFRYDMAQSNRADPYLKEINSIFQDNRPKSLEEAISQTITNDKDTDGNLTINEMSNNKKLFEEFDEAKELEKLAQNDYNKNHLDVNFNLWGNLFKNNSSQENLDKMSAMMSPDEAQIQNNQNPTLANNIENQRINDIANKQGSEKVDIMSFEDKNKLFENIKMYAEGMQNQEEQNQTDADNTQQQNYELLSQQFDLFLNTYEDVEQTKEEEKSQEDLENEQAISEALDEALNDINPEYKDDVKKALYVQRDYTSSFEDKKSAYINQINDTIEQKDLLAQNMVYLDEFLDKNDITKDDFLNSEELQNNFKDDLKNKDNIDTSKDLVENRDLTKDEWRTELQELYQFFNDEEIISSGLEMQNFKSQNEELLKNQDSDVVEEMLKKYQQDTNQIVNSDIYKATKDVIATTFQKVFNQNIEDSIIEDDDKKQQQAFQQATQQRIENLLRNYEDMQNINFEGLDIKNTEITIDNLQNSNIIKKNSIIKV